MGFYEKQIPMKKFLVLLLCIALCASMIACGKNSDSDALKAFNENVVIDEVPLSDEEKELIELIGSDITVVSDEDYISAISELTHHPAEYAGYVFQIEGVLSYEGDQITLYRTLVHGEQTQILGMPVNYLVKDFEDNSWVRLTAIISDVDGVTALDVIAAEGLAEVGSAALAWDGNDTHQH